MVFILRETTRKARGSLGPVPAGTPHAPPPRDPTLCPALPPSGSAPRTGAPHPNPGRRGARRPQQGLAGKAPSRGPLARSARQEAPAEPGAAPRGCPGADGALGGCAPRMLADVPGLSGDPGRSRRHHPPSPRSAQSQKRQRMTSSRIYSSSLPRDVITPGEPSDRQK